MMVYLLPVDLCLASFQMHAFAYVLYVNLSPYHTQQSELEPANAMGELLY